MDRLDKDKGKMPEYEVVHHDDSDSDVSAASLDSEFGVPIMWTAGVKKALTSTNEKLHRSSQAKNPVTRYAYNEYMAHHYAFTMKVAAEQEPERPSLCHRLEGEKRPNCANRRKEGQTAQSRGNPHKGQIPQIHAKAANRAKPQRDAQAELPRKATTKPKESKPDVGRPTLELEGAC